MENLSLNSNLRYYKGLAKLYPSISAASREIINLKAILNLPKGTEYFISDLHGEYETFKHILNNCSGVVREKVINHFNSALSTDELNLLCALIYYPEKKLKLLEREGKLTSEFYLTILKRLISLARFLSSKYTRSKVRKALPLDYSYIIDELMHAQTDEHNNQLVYHENIYESIISTGAADEFVIALSVLIKRLAVDKLHILGDIFDRGASPDKIIDDLMGYHNVSILWGNHDILWLGAASGSDACIMSVIFNCLKYNTTSVLEKSYGICLRPLFKLAEKLFPKEPDNTAAIKTAAVIMFKLENEIISRRKEFNMTERKVLEKIDLSTFVFGRDVKLLKSDFPTLTNGLALTKEEKELVCGLSADFTLSPMLNRHASFLYEKGGMYAISNGNLLFHGCMPVDEYGKFIGLAVSGENLKGKAYFDFCDKTARAAFYSRDLFALDFMWYLWCGFNSPLYGRVYKSFERLYLSDETARIEPKNPYYSLYENENFVNSVLNEFNLSHGFCHIINGHTPIKTKKGESPLKASGKLIAIDGGFCSAYREATGIAGYTLIFNSHGMRIKAHQPFDSTEVLSGKSDIYSSSDVFIHAPSRIFVKHADNGKEIRDSIAELEELLRLYRENKI